jgi:hypothetical protein
VGQALQKARIQTALNSSAVEAQASAAIEPKSYQAGGIPEGEIKQIGLQPPAK